MFSAVLQHFFPKFGENITAFCEERNLCMYVRLPHMDINVAVSLHFVLMQSCPFALQFELAVLAISLQSSTNLHFIFPQHICMFSSWMELNLKVPSHIFENLQNMCIICDKSSCRICGN